MNTNAEIETDTLVRNPIHLPVRRSARRAIPLGTRIGANFEPVVTTPRQLVEMMDCSDKTIKGLHLAGEDYKLSSRFFKTLASRLDVPFGVFGLFTPFEVMNRAAELHPGMPLRMTVDTESKEVLGLVENKGVPMPIRFIENVLHDDPRLKEVAYGEGLLEATLDLDEQWNVPNDSKYHVRVRCRVPVDGATIPDMNLATWRQVCSNGAVAEAPLFRTKMEIKDNSGEHFRRLLASFSNPTGVELLQQKMHAASETKASVGEVVFLEGLIRRVVPNGRNQMLLRERLYEVAENPCVRYGVTDLSNIGMKKRSLLPVGCSVADLLNFASELQTHHRELLKDENLLQTFPGTLLAKGFDLEDLYPNARTTSSFYLNDISFAREAS